MKYNGEIKMKKIFLYDQDRALLIFFLLVNFLDDEVVYITYKKNIDKIKNLKGEKILFDENDLTFKKRLKMGINIKNFRRKYNSLLEGIYENKVELYGIHYFELAQRIFYKEEIISIEEGTATYSEFPVTIKGKIKYFLINIFNEFLGLKERQDFKNWKIKKIYLTTNLCKKVPNKYKNNYKLINLKDLWNKKTEVEKSYILNFFNFNNEILKKFSKNVVILLTQPLSEDKIILEERKIEIYSKILNNYLKESILIKPHPREITDYKKYFPSYYIMEEKYPIEILNLVGINVKKVVTLFSGAVFNFGENVEIDFYGTEVDKNIYKRFGNCDNLMKRNSFLIE